MASVKERLAAKVGEVRRRRPSVDHAVKTVQHYGEVNGNGQAAAVTFFGFLSFFPLLALAFFVVGLVANVYSGVESNLETAINTILPGLVGDEDGQISLDDFRENAGTIGVVGFVTVLYSGLGWLSGMREALLTMFKMPQREQPNFVVGKLRDLVVLAVVGVTLIVSVALTGIVSVATEFVLEFTLGLVGLENVPGLGALLWVIGHVLGIAATTLLFLAMFVLLAQPEVPRRSLWQGAILGAVGFEVLKTVASILIGATKEQPAFQAFGVALILVVWINYFSRVTMFGAAWAYTSPLAEDARARGYRHMPGAALEASSEPAAEEAEAAPRHRAVGGRGARRKAIVRGGAVAGVSATGALVALRRRRGRGKSL